MLDFFTVVWGEMIETFLGFALPSLLQEGNIPAIRQLSNYNFYASDQARIIITQNERFHELEKLIPIRWEPLQKGEWEVNSNVKHQMSISARQQHYMLHLEPDVAWGNWSLFNLANLTDGTRNPVQYSFPRINEQGYSQLRQMFREGKSISNRELVTLAMQHIEQNNYPIRQIGNKWMVRHSAPSPCILPDEKIIGMFAQNHTPNDLFHVLSYMMIEAGYRFYIIAHSDVCFRVERGVHTILKHPETGVRWRPDKAVQAFRFYMNLEQTWQGVEENKMDLVKVSAKLLTRFGVMMDKDKADRALFEFADIADGLKVTWFLVLGACLGFVRDGGYISNDDDIDLGVMCDRQTLKELFTRLEAGGFKKEQAFLNPGNEVNQHFLKDGILLDIFVTFLEKERQYLDSFDKVEYEGRKFRVPHPVEAYLTCEYGYWRIPGPKVRGSEGSIYLPTIWDWIPESATKRTNESGGKWGTGTCP